MKLNYLNLFLAILNISLNIYQLNFSAVMGWLCACLYLSRIIYLESNG